MSWTVQKELEEKRQKAAYEARKILTDNKDGLSEEERSIVDRCHLSSGELKPASCGRNWQPGLMW
jgi:hypothetical protein